MKKCGKIDIEIIMNRCYNFTDKGGETVNTSGDHNILERLDCYVAHISAFYAVKGGTMSKNEYL